MRIAQVSPLYESVPPKTYGGTERVVSWLTEELVRRGHDVTLFASGDSMTSARLVPGSKQALRNDTACKDQLAPHLAMVEQVFRQKENFDLIHFHVDYLHFPASRRERVTSVTTLHGRLDMPELVPIYQLFRDIPTVSISDAQREPLPWINWQGTVYHGMPPDRYSYSAGGGKYLAFLGRTSPEKGLDQAIEIAQRVDMPLKIAAKVDRADVEYFERVIKSKLDHPLVEFLGEIGYPEKQEFLGNAAALLFPINWPEPFGIVMIEAMACGTPVIAYPYGSVPEVVDHGITGFVVPGVDGAVEALHNIESFDREHCRKRFEERFTAERMTDDYLKVYQRLVTEPPAVSEGVLNWMKLTSPSSTT